ncbi:PREDICTED: uncharacterized protein LOC104610336 [Nelumbo nucifera]|uniref:Uncharacterized protein LOC104610336 n=1 Tax=Nelumbo nucifera TaxID=4432 RepID=A0A1U8BFG5_NELNU|nr:PREDICTED: uncharacterized protein LOC104610336 [Nelumbo nucifera]
MEKDITLDGDEVPKRKFPPLFDYKPVPPFPNALVGSRKDEQFKNFYETFRRYEANIPLFNALKQIPYYAKFLKELCKHKRKQKLKGCEKVRVGENISTVIKKLPTKYKDPGMFTIPGMIGNTRIEKAMLNLGASINVMPYSIYASMELGPLNKTGVVIQLADRSNAYPKGIVEDVLVKVNDLVFPTDFYVLDMDNGDQTTLILLGRPFLKTSKTKIDVYSGTLTMEFDGKIEIFKLNENDGLEVSISKHLEKEEPMLNADLQKTVAALNDSPDLQQSGNAPYVILPISDRRHLPSILQAHIPELKPLPNHLKHVFLGDGETLPVIISSSLSTPQEEQLV